MSEFDLKHALAVASKFEYGTEEWLVALLHDSVEDGALTDRDLWESNLPTSVRYSVLWLTRHRDEPYDAYIRYVSIREVSARVKIADLETNLARMDEAHESLRPRYERALATLRAALPSASGESREQRRQW